MVFLLWKAGIRPVCRTRWLHRTDEARGAARQSVVGFRMRKRTGSKGALTVQGCQAAGCHCRQTDGLRVWRAGLLVLAEYFCCTVPLADGHDFNAADVDMGRTLHCPPDAFSDIHGMQRFCIFIKLA